MVLLGGGYLLSRRKKSSSTSPTSENGVVELSDGTQVLWRIVHSSGDRWNGFYSPPAFPGFERRWIRAAANVSKAAAREAAIRFAKSLDPQSSDIVASDEIAEGRWRVRRLADGRYQGEYLRRGSDSWAIALPPRTSPDEARLLALEGLAWSPSSSTPAPEPEPEPAPDPESVCRHLLEILKRDAPGRFTDDDLPACIDAARNDPEFAAKAAAILAATSLEDLVAAGVIAGGDRPSPELV